MNLKANAAVKKIPFEKTIKPRKDFEEEDKRVDCQDLQEKSPVSTLRLLTTRLVSHHGTMTIDQLSDDTMMSRKSDPEEAHLTLILDLTPLDLPTREDEGQA
jgi:hypothetical protein